MIAQVERNALKPVERKPSRLSGSSEIGVKDMMMQQQMGRLEEELRRAKAELSAVEEERNRAIDEVQRHKKVADEANSRLNNALSPDKAEEIFAELETLKKAMLNSNHELKMKEKVVESLRFDLGKVKEFELKLVEKDESLERLKEELGNAKASEEQAIDLLSESEKKVQKFAIKMERWMLAESRLLDSLAAQTKQVEETKIELEKSKVEIVSLHQKIENSDALSTQNGRNLNGFDDDEKNASNQEYKKVVSLKPNAQIDETVLLKNELKLATEAEEKSMKAMDDLALALKEVATEASEAKKKLSSLEIELKQAKEVEEQIKLMGKNTEEKYVKLLDEAKKETELYRNITVRLRLEAEESLLAWNGKEMGFVDCIKKADEEKAHVQRENVRLNESLKIAEKMTRSAKEEANKLRDILKQALNEANVAKEAANIAKEENSQLKDCLTERDETLYFLTQQNENLRINEAAAQENIKELKRLLSSTTAELKTEGKDQPFGLNSPSSTVEDLEDTNVKIINNDHEKAEALKGSILDSVVSHKSETKTPSEDGGTNYDDFDHVDESISGDSDSDRNSHKRRRALLRRFSDIISMSKGFRKRESQAD